MSDVGDVNRAHSIGEDDLDALVRAAEGMVNPSGEIEDRLNWLTLARPARIIRMGELIRNLPAENAMLLGMVIGD